MSVRPPVVAGRFYPAHPDRLRAEVAAYMPETAREPALAVIVPHAGYMYSGATAGATVTRVAVPETVLLLGPNHTGLGAACSLSPDDWQIPGATIPQDRELAGAILQHSSMVQEERAAHRGEHSLEVELPFLYQTRPDLRIACLTLGGLNFALCERLARELAAALADFGRPVLLLASTDMNHYESRAVGGRKDRAAIERILALDAPGLYETVRRDRTTMCGVLPVCVTILLALAQGASRAELVRHTDSGEASGDTERVVGYAGLVIA